MSPGQVVHATGQDDRQALRGEIADQERDEILRRAIDPVDVLDDERGRAGLGQRVEQPEHALEQAGLAETGWKRSRGGVRNERTWHVRGQLRHDRREVSARRPEQALEGIRRDRPRQPAQGGGDGEIGKPAGPDVETLADEDQRSLPAGRVRGLLHEARLADPSLAPHDDEPRGTRRAGVDLPDQGGGIPVATDKLRARDAGGHGNDGTAALKAP